MKKIQFGRFFADTGGQFAIIAAVYTIPLIAAMSIAVDYSRMSTVRSDLQYAVDSATLAAISKASETYKKGGVFDLAWSQEQAKAEAEKWFRANRQSTVDYTVTSSQIDVVRSGTDIKATMTVTASVKTTFVGIVGIADQSFNIYSAATSTLAPYMDVHVLSDNSPSMALGATPADITKLKSLTGCAFACHDLSKSNDSYAVAVANKIPLRIDATREALTSMIDTMQTVQEQYNQFRVSAYHFGDKIEVQKLTNFIAQTTDLVKAKTDSTKLKLMTVPYNVYNQNMATNYKLQLDQADLVIGTAGTGLTTLDRRQLLMLITDGVNTTYKPAKCLATVTPWGQCQSTIDPTWCSALKARGVQIAVLNTSYYPIGDQWYDDWIKPFQDQIAVKLSQCASPGLFAEVQPHQGITEAMQAIFIKSLPKPRLTN